MCEQFFSKRTTNIICHAVLGMASRQSFRPSLSKTGVHYLALCLFCFDWCRRVRLAVRRTASGRPFCGGRLHLLCVVRYSDTILSFAGSLLRGRDLPPP